MLWTSRSDIPVLIQGSCEGNMARAVAWDVVFLVMLCGFVEFVCFLYGSPLYRWLITVSERNKNIPYPAMTHRPEVTQMFEI